MKKFLCYIGNFCDVLLKKTYTSVFKIAQSQEPKKTPSPNVFISILSPLESYVVSIQSLLIWERPYLSAASFVALNCLFWLAVSWNRRFFSIIACICLAVFLQQTWVKRIWPEIRAQPEDESEGWTPVHPQVLSVPELSQYINDFWKTIKKWWNDIMRLRKANHGLFCILGCTFFSLLAFLGHLVPGVLLIYSLVLGISLGPGIALHLIPGTIYEQLIGFFVDNTSSSISKKSEAGTSKYDNDSDLDEFLPNTSSDVLEELSLRRESMQTNVGDFVGGAHITEEYEDDLHITTIRELGMDSFICESEESSMCAGLTGFPSVEEEGESDLEEELSGNIDTPKPGPDSSNMHFVATHFKEESSDSDSDEVFTEGLSFSNETNNPVKNEKPNMPLKRDKKGKALLPKARVSASSDDELMDFEMIDDPDIS